MMDPHDQQPVPGRGETLDVIKRNWRAEVGSARVYRDLAEREPDEKRQGILRRMERKLFIRRCFGISGRGSAIRAAGRSNFIFLI